VVRTCVEVELRCVIPGDHGAPPVPLLGTELGRDVVLRCAVLGAELGIETPVCAMLPADSCARHFITGKTTALQNRNASNTCTDLCVKLS
jgi:hypothetical protein